MHQMEPHGEHPGAYLRLLLLVVVIVLVRGRSGHLRRSPACDGGRTACGCSALMIAVVALATFVGG